MSVELYGNLLRRSAELRTNPQTSPEDWAAFRKHVAESLRLANDRNTEAAFRSKRKQSIKVIK